jgi:hypothetical protein
MRSSRFPPVECSPRSGWPISGAKLRTTASTSAEVEPSPSHARAPRVHFDLKTGLTRELPPRFPDLAFATSQHVISVLVPPGDRPLRHRRTGAAEI